MPIPRERLPAWDQFNILIPPELAAGGQQVVTLILMAAAQTANAVDPTVK